MSGIMEWFNIDLLKEICKDYFQNRGYEVETDVALADDLRWRPSVVAKRNQEVIALEVRTTEDLPDYLINAYKEAKDRIPSLKMFLCIPKEAKVSKKLILTNAKLGIGIYQIDGTSLEETYSPDHETTSSIEEESGVRKQEFVISPDTPYGNVRALRTILRNCQGFIFWFEKHFARNVIERLYDELADGNLSNIQEIRILCGPANVTTKFKDDFKRFIIECRKFDITAKCKVICDKKTLNELHHRYLLTQGNNYSLPPLSSIEMGQWSSLFETYVQFPFEKYWRKGRDIVRKWDEIFKVGEEIRKKKKE